MHGTLNKTRNKRVRSGVTSGKRLFAERINSMATPQGMRFFDLINEYTDACGGNDRIDEATRNTIRRIAFLQCVLEDREADYVKTGTVTMEQTLEYQRTANTQSRLMKKAGLFSSKKTDEDEDDAINPLDYVKGHTRTKRSRLEDDDEED